jgi:hypothetical protein
MAIHCWQDSFDSGLSLYEETLWHDALPYLGCAYETSEILLSTHAVEPSNAREMFTQSASLLMNTTLAIKAHEMTQEIYRLSLQRLMRELAIEPLAEREIALQLKHLQQCSRPQVSVRSKACLDLAMH